MYWTQYDLHTQKKKVGIFKKTKGGIPAVLFLLMLATLNFWSVSLQNTNHLPL